MLDTLTINLKHQSYPILIGRELFRPEIVQEYICGQHLMIVSNETVASLYLSEVQHCLSDYKCNHIVLPDGESHKNLSTVNSIFDMLLKHRHGRDTTIIALGGGVTGDIAGFSAACYQRGVNFIQIPTTLLAQVDASVGGKTGVNHSMGKNMIGAFHQPEAVIINLDTLSSLPEREFSAGMSEIIKAALLADKAFFNWLCSQQSAIRNHDYKLIEDENGKMFVIKIKEEDSFYMHYE